MIGTKDDDFFVIISHVMCLSVIFCVVHASCVLFSNYLGLFANTLAVEFTKVSFDAPDTIVGELNVKLLVNGVSLYFPT